MSLLTLVTLLIATATIGVDGQGETSEDQSDIPKRPFDNLLVFKEEHYKEAFKTLDVNNDDVIKIDDLQTFYYHTDSQFAIQKFMDLIDTQKTPGSIDLEEFTKFMKKDQVKRQAYEILFIATVEGRKFYADEILTYVYVVLEQNAIDKLFDEIETSQDGKLDLNEIKKMQVKFMNGDTKYELSDGEAKLVLAEIGAGSETISKEDFKYYLEDGDLGLLFRECRKKLTATGAEYDNACLIRKVVQYTTSHLTEYMMTRVFDALDASYQNEKLSIKDIQLAFGCNMLSAMNFRTYINGYDNKDVTYGEIRTVLRFQPTKYLLEQDCLVKGKESADIEERVLCLSWELWNLISNKFSPKLISVPDLDLMLLFEDLDTNNDGIIEEKEDLETGKGWGPGLAAKFMDELDYSDNKGKVNLRDFFHFVFEPYMMCALGECQIIKDNNEKLACYHNEMKDMITNTLDKKEVDKFYGFYKHHLIYYVTLEKFNMLHPVVESFLNELGQGDHYVNPIEFRHFVKQQEVVRLSVTDENVSPRKHLPESELHEKLLSYLENHMTEFDIVILFARLDTNSNGMIDSEDVEDGDVDDKFVARIALYGNKAHATFPEFWLFLNTKAPGAQETRKRKLEKECGQINQEKQLICFTNNLNGLQ